jgi:hypothetical protein
MDNNIVIKDLEIEISKHLGIQLENLIFDFEVLANGCNLNLITINPQHKQSFLFKSIQADNKISALNSMLKYVKEYKDIEQSFTIQWSLKNENELHTSYFRAGNIFQALEKFSFGRDMNSIIVFSVVLNPIS